MKRILPALLACLLLWLGPVAAWAAPVQWQEVPPTEAGRQWWDAGSLRLGRNGRLTVLSRFQSSPDPTTAAGGGDPAESPLRPGPSSLYVMELDCEGLRYRDTSVNGLPRFDPAWKETADDPLTAATVAQACAAGAPLLAGATAKEQGNADG